jgi:hypothetical protein
MSDRERASSSNGLVELDPSEENRTFSTPLLEEISSIEEFLVEESKERKSILSFNNLFRKYDFAKSSRPNETKGKIPF